MHNEIRVAGSTGGNCNSSGSKGNQGMNGYWWSQEGNNWNLNYNNTNLNQNGTGSTNGYSVRCVRNLTGTTFKNNIFAQYRLSQPELPIAMASVSVQS